jgi:dinuclear metal center YbgI/SA1388 family protein
VQGKSDIRTIVTGVTASLALIEKAIEEQADAILVHHGWFWKNDDPRVIRQLHARLKSLMQHDINLFAYHLPLDQHSELGNNAQLARVLGFEIGGQSKENDLVWYGTPHKPSGRKTLQVVALNVEQKLRRAPLVIGEPSRKIKTVAWCTGTAQGYIDIAAKLGADVYISGEISEQTTHAAEELGIAYICAGHHATESYGVQALGKNLAKAFELRHIHVDVPNPV